MKTSEELVNLAQDMLDGKVFTSLMIRPDDMPHMLMRIFRPIARMPAHRLDRLISQHPLVLYAYMQDASPRTYKGYPQFSRFDFLTGPEYDILEWAILVLQATREAQRDRIFRNPN